MFHRAINNIMIIALKNNPDALVVIVINLSVITMASLGNHHSTPLLHFKYCSWLMMELDAASL